MSLKLKRKKERMTLNALMLEFDFQHAAKELEKKDREIATLQKELENSKKLINYYKTKQQKEEQNDNERPSSSWS
jgi:hypothetical protein